MNEDKYMLHRVEVHLALSAINAANPDATQFAIDPQDVNDGGPSLPSLPLGKGVTSYEVARRLFTLLTGTDDSWLPIRQVGTFHDEDVVIILYAVNMPELVPIKNAILAQWVNFEELSKYPKLLRLYGHACNAYKIGESA